MVQSKKKLGSRHTGRFAPPSVRDIVRALREEAQPMQTECSTRRALNEGHSMSSVDPLLRDVSDEKAQNRGKFLSSI